MKLHNLGWQRVQKIIKVSGLMNLCRSRRAQVVCWLVLAIFWSLFKLEIVDRVGKSSFSIVVSTVSIVRTLLSINISLDCSPVFCSTLDEIWSRLVSLWVLLLWSWIIGSFCCEGVGNGRILATTFPSDEDDPLPAIFRRDLLDLLESKLLVLYYFQFMIVFEF